MPSAFIRLPADYPEALKVLGEEITVLAGGEETGGYEMFIQAGDEGVGPPPHRHDWDESFYVLSGEIEFGVGDRSALCGSGAVVHVPAGCTHWFRFMGKGAMLSITSRLGASRFYANVARDTSGTIDVETTVKVALAHGMSFPQLQGEC